MELFLDFVRHIAAGMAGYLAGKLFYEAIKTCVHELYPERTTIAALPESDTASPQPTPDLHADGNRIDNARTRPWSPPQAAPQSFFPQTREYLLSIPQLQSGSRLDEPPSYSSLEYTRTSIV